VNGEIGGGYPCCLLLEMEHTWGVNRSASLHFGIAFQNYTKRPILLRKGVLSPNWSQFGDKTEQEL